MRLNVNFSYTLFAMKRGVDLYTFIYIYTENFSKIIKFLILLFIIITSFLFLSFFLFNIKTLTVNFPIMEQKTEEDLAHSLDDG